MSDIASKTAALMPGLLDDLKALARIPSVSAPGFDASQVQRSAQTTADLLADAGYTGVRLLEVGDAHPAVYAELPGPDGAPTVLLYAHHDVQPPGPEDAWTTPPFEPTEVEGRLFGRGAADDKCGIMIHSAMPRVFDGSPPVNLKVFVEGEEEIGSANLEAFLAEHGDALAADVIVVSDSSSWRVGVPAITESLRGLISARVDVEALESGLHSGMFGGAVPDALTILSRVLATLHDERGQVAIPGLVSTDADPLDLTEDELREQAGMLPGVRFIGDGALTSRLWTKPAASVLAIDAPPIGEAINQLVPRASAKVSVRLAPGDDPDRAMQALIDHLTAADAWGASVTVTPLESGRPFALTEGDPRVGAFRDAMRATWGVDPIDMGVGGSIPFVAAFSERFPNAAILLVGAADPTSALHAPNESLHLGDFEKSIVAQAKALELLAE